MKKLMKEIKTDLRAAVVLGHPEAVEAVLETLSQVPQFAGNHQMEEHFVIDQLVPLGEMVAKSSFPLDELSEMLDSSTTVYRVIAAVGLIFRWKSQEKVRKELLKQAGDDPRAEVRAAVVHILKSISADQTELVMDLIDSWLDTTSNRLKLTSVQVFPAFYSFNSEEILDTIYEYTLLEDYEINRALVDSLNEIAQNSHGKEIMDRLEIWSHKRDPNQWVICKILSNTWVVEYTDQAAAVLHNLERSRGHSEIIEKTFKQLQYLNEEINNS